MHKLLSKVSIPSNPNQCWEWSGKLNNGYGRMTFAGKHIGAHRISYELFHLEKTDGFFVCHKCDNRKCVNPAHLFLGTCKDNLVDASSKKRFFNQTKTHCSQGHPLSGENLYQPKTMSKGRHNHRACKICRSVHHKSENQKRKAARNAICS